MSDVNEDEFLSDVDGAEETPLKAVEEDEKVPRKDKGKRNGEHAKLMPTSHLTKEIISEGLSLLCRTGNGLGHAFVRLDLEKKGLNDIAAISSYMHIRYLDLTNNYLTDLSPLASLTQLLWLKVDGNAVSCFKGQPFAQLIFLQWLSMVANQLKDLDGLVGPSLENLNLTGNSIQRMKGFQSGHFANLVTLELRGNQLETTGGINLPNLQRLYLAQNVIKHLEGLEKLERLTILHLRDNQLETLDGLSPNMKCLRYLNVRGNAITDKKALQSLGFVSKTLQILVLSDNPLVETLDYRLNVLIFIPQLERLDKELVALDESMEARSVIRDLAKVEIPGHEISKNGQNGEMFN